MGRAAGAAFVSGAAFAWTPDVRFAPDAKPGFLRSPEWAGGGVVPEGVRRRRAASAGGLSRRVFSFADVGDLRAVAAGVDAEVEVGPGAGVAGTAAGALGSVFPRSARLARELGGFGRAVGSTGLVILRVIRAMSMRGRRG